MKILLNPDTNKVAEIKEAIKNNEGYCPCRLAKIKENRCICKDFSEQTEEGYCLCGLYYKTSEE